MSVQDIADADRETQLTTTEVQKSGIKKWFSNILDALRGLREKLKKDGKNNV